MQTYLRFAAGNGRLLSFGFLLALFSGFGQTFLISLYIPEIATTFTLSNTEISSMYATATIASAFTLPWIGRHIDFQPLVRFSLAVVIGLAIALVALSLALNPIMVMVGFWGLRLTGQALMGHTAVTTMARAYDLDRGKAISLANIGHPVGEAIFPLIIALLIETYGWQLPLRLSALSLIILVVPLVLLLLRGANPAILYPNQAEEQGKPVGNGRFSNPARLLRSKSFWILLPAITYLGAINTAIFFFQIQFGESRGWSVSWVAGCIAAFATANALGMLIAGPLVDRLTARRLYPVFLVPYLGGLVVLASFQHAWVYPVALVFMGFSNGTGSTIINAIYAEIFGTDAIGSVRSIFATIGVFATALGPISFGLMLDGGLQFNAMLLISAGTAVIVMLWSALIWQKK